MRIYLALALVLASCQQAPKVAATATPEQTAGAVTQIGSQACVQPGNYDVQPGIDADGELITVTIELRNCGTRAWRGLKFVSVVLALPERIVLTEPFRLPLGEAGPGVVTNLRYLHRYSFAAGHYSVWMQVISGEGSSAKTEFELSYAFELVPKQ